MGKFGGFQFRSLCFYIKHFTQWDFFLSVAVMMFNDLWRSLLPTHSLKFQAESFSYPLSLFCTKGISYLPFQQQILRFFLLKYTLSSYHHLYTRSCICNSPLSFLRVLFKTPSPVALTYITDRAWFLIALTTITTKYEGTLRFDCCSNFLKTHPTFVLLLHKH